MTDGQSLYGEFMAIIVDKEQKRKDIALACKELFIREGIAKITISQIAKEAGVGKGTIYDYFANKEDIVFAILDILMAENNAYKEAKIQEANSTKEKIRVFFEFFYDPAKADLREIFKEFISISLSNPSPEMQTFFKEGFDRYYLWFKAILQEGVDKGEIKPIAIDLSRGFFALGEGLFITNLGINRMDCTEEEINLHVETIFKLIEEKQ
jgi:AcrR family transcriptional regulator